MRLIVHSVVAVVGATLVACSSGGDVSSPTESVLGPVQTPAGSTESTNKPSPQTAWCSVSLGTQMVDVLYVMGRPDDYKLAANDQRLQPGQETAEWDRGSDIFVATFTDGKATSLQAYDKVIGSAGATDITCDPSRK